MRNKRIVIFVPSVNCQLENRSICAVSVHLCRGFFYRHKCTENNTRKQCARGQQHDADYCYYHCVCSCGRHSGSFDYTEKEISFGNPAGLFL